MRGWRNVLLALAGLATLALHPAGADEQEKRADATVMPEMTTYTMGLLRKGPAWTSELTPELERLQRDHLAHIGRMAESGKLVIAGPLTDDGEIRGILVFKTDSLEEAEALADRDPMIRAGHLELELHPWMVAKGILP